jgi:PAS domain S-box-containing protein
MNRRELLIIDDDRSIHQLLTQYFRVRGITAYFAFSGPSGLEILEKHPSIHTVLTDIRIPGMDGLDVLREIKQRHPLTQVILMTAFSDKNLAIQALRLGADDYLEKPFRLEDLAQLLDRSHDRRRLQAFSERWQQFLVHLPLGFLWCSSRGVIEGIAPGAQAMIGCESEELIGKPLWQVKGFEKSKALFEATSQVLSSVEIEVCGRFVILQKVESNPGAEIPATFVVLTDVSEQKLLQNELAVLTAEFEEKVEERTQSLTSEIAFSERLLDTASVLIAYYDHEGHLVRLNKFAEDLIGYGRHEAEQVFAYYASDKQSLLTEIFDPRSQQEISDRIAEIRTRDGTSRILSWSTRLLPGRLGKRGRLIIGIDVTEQKQLEATLQNYNLHLEDMVETRSTQLRQKDAQLIHTARLASLGEMAAGIAHELKQPLNVISITADLIRLLNKNRTLTEEILYSNLDKIRHTVERMANTINHLRGFTRIDSTNFRPVGIGEAVEGALAILGEQIRLDNIDIIKEIPKNIPPVQGELSQIEQVLVNLMQNARDAIVEKILHEEEQGEFTSEPRILTISAGELPSGKEVFIEVKDSGVGMTEEVQEKLFEPFFTTKDEARGTGLGLSICQNIVHSHSGEIQVESVAGEGSTFRVILPVENKDVSEEVTLRLPLNDR